MESNADTLLFYTTIRLEETFSSNAHPQFYLCAHANLESFIERLRPPVADEEKKSVALEGFAGASELLLPVNRAALLHAPAVERALGVGGLSEAMEQLSALGTWYGSEGHSLFYG